MKLSLPVIKLNGALGVFPYFKSIHHKWEAISWETFNNNTNILRMKRECSLLYMLLPLTSNTVILFSNTRAWVCVCVCTPLHSPQINTCVGGRICICLEIRPYVNMTKCTNTHYLHKDACTFSLVL